jgi:hypothetical protein
MFSPKAPVEIVTLTFDFSALTGGVTNALLTVAASIGVDAAPAAILSGMPQVSGAKVLQKVQGGLSGVHYELTCQVDTSDGESRYALKEVLPVIN